MGAGTIRDALIAATALTHALPVLTANARHFEAIQGLAVERFDPSVSST